MTTIGFIDVPGHERFIRNALCGLAGTDFVLLIVAADDGPMPQTREHLAIVDLLGIGNGAVALTKVDRVSPDRIAQVRSEIGAMLAGTSLQDAPVLPVSAVTGDGIAALKDHLVGTGAELPARSADHNFRMAVDRTFDVVGVGFVATGTVFSGTVSAGDRVVVAGPGTQLRVRGIHAQNAAATTGRSGQRCALNLTGQGLRKEMIQRGMWVSDERVPAPVAKLDCQLRVLPSMAHPLQHWTPVHVHLGAAEATGRVAVLEGLRVEAGQSGLVQLVLDKPIGAVAGDRFIIRDQSARYTIGGGQVVDIFPPARGRARPERLAWLAHMRQSDAGEALAGLLQVAPSGVDLDRFAACRNLTAEEMAAVECVTATKLVAGYGVRLAFAPAAWDGVGERVRARLEAWHEAYPGAIGLGENKVLAGTGIHVPATAAVAIVSALIAEGQIVKEDMGVRLPTHQARLDPADAKLWAAIGPVIAGNGVFPISVREIAAATDIEWRRVEAFLVRAGRLGLVYRISKNRYLRPPAVRALAAMAERLAAEAADGLVAVAEFRDAAEVGRNRSVEIMEFFDAKHFTQRVGDRRRIMVPAAAVFGTD